MAKKSGAKKPKAEDRCKVLTVEFNEDYVASRGAGIAGREGDVKKYAWSPDLAKLIEEEVVTVKKTEVRKASKPEAAKRETATQ